jgi:hypothetical protein
MSAIKGMDAGGTDWAKIPPPCGAKGSAWERNIIDLAEAGDTRFTRILSEHVKRGVIISDRARAALEAYGHDLTSPA